MAARQAHDRIEGEDRDPLWIRAVGALGPSAETWLFVAVYLGFFVGSSSWSSSAAGEGRRCGRRWAPARRCWAPRRC